MHRTKPGTIRNELHYDNDEVLYRLTYAVGLHQDLLLLVAVNAVDEVQVGILGGHDYDLSILMVVDRSDRRVRGNDRADLNATGIPLHRLHIRCMWTRLRST